MPDADLQTIINEAFRRLNEAGRRLRTLEERFALIETNISNDKDVIIKNQTETNASVSKIFEQLDDLGERIRSVENEMVRINKVLEKTARKTEVEELRGTISLFSPFSSKFVTEGDVKKIMEKAASGEKEE
ncbi:MAG TPA: hypothetical protein VI933_02955 [archaeon]|nr:hypothetical protein [archaeon]